jgi:hypothetical protein
MKKSTGEAIEKGLVYVGGAALLLVGAAAIGGLLGALKFVRGVAPPDEKKGDEP